MSGKLYLVATPIGNLGDISARAAETLSGADFIAAEDTRVTLKLLNHLGIKKPLVSYYEHNRLESGERIIARLAADEVCALVTDAGMPAISDPGEDIVRLCAENDIPVEVVPGPCALVCAVALSSLPSQRFTFEGFLSRNAKSRREHLEAIKNEPRTMVFYEAPHKLIYTLRDLLSYLGDREVTVCRELTKLHEQTLRTTLSAAVEYFSETPPRGEFVLVVAGQKENPVPFTTEDGIALAEGYIADGMSVKDASKRASEETGVAKNELYRALTKR